MSGAWLTRPLVTAAWCWRLARRDGMVVALTSHDRDLMLAGQLYRAAPGMRPSQIEQSDRFESHSIELSGAVSAAAIRAEDIDAGRWDGAALTLLMADWEDLGNPPLAVAKGELGQVVRKGQEFTVELAGPLRTLDQGVGVTTSPTCRAKLGDGDCRVPLAALTWVRTAIALDGRTLTLAGPVPSQNLAFGRLRWLDGPAAGLECAIVAQDGEGVTLAERPKQMPSLPTRVELRAGCDKRLDSCTQIYDNAVNFRGEAHLPGFDLLTRYPSG